MVMKTFSLILLSLVAAATLFAQSTNNPNQMKVRWDGSPDAIATSYQLYYKTISATNFLSTNIVGHLNTNAVISVVPGIVYELYVTAKTDTGLESDASNKIRGQNVLVNGFGKETVITVFDAIPTNIPQFQLLSSPSNGVSTITLPTIRYTATNTVGKDMFVFKSPELFMNQNVTSYVAVYRAIQNTPTITVP